MPGSPTRPPRSWWSTTAIGSAVLVWVGGVLLHLLGTLGPVVGFVGVVASAVAWVREPGPWRILMAFVGLACMVATALYALVLTGTTGWPPTGW